MLIIIICKNIKILKKNKNMIRGIHYFSTELKTKIDVIPRGCLFHYHILYVNIFRSHILKVNFFHSHIFNVICLLFSHT